MSVVLDASLALSWFFADEHTHQSRNALDLIASSGAHVPSLWRLEVANGIQVGIRRSRLSPMDRLAALQLLDALPIVIDLETNRYAWSETLRLADEYALTVYDAAYLELARRMKVPLASLDRALVKAAEASGLPILAML